MRASRAFLVGLVLSSALGASACRGPDLPTFGVERSALLAVLRVMVMLDGELVLAETGEVSFITVVDMRSCAVSGTVAEYDDGRLEFDQCAMSADTTLDGTVRRDATGVTFEGFTGRGPAGPFSLQGGYTETDDGTVLQITLGLSGSYPGLDEGTTYAFEMTGSMTYDRTARTLSGSFRFVQDTGNGEPTTRDCSFAAAALPVILSLFSGDDTIETLCPDPQGDVDARFELVNAHTDGMNIHIKRPGEPFETSNRLGPGESRTRRIATQGGISLAWEAGRNGEVLAYVTCPPAARDVTLTVRWRAGIGAGELVCE